MDRLEMIYQDEYIEIYFKEDLISNEFFLANLNLGKVIARYINSDFKYVHLAYKKVKFEHLKKFHEVVADYLIKKGE